QVSQNPVTDRQRLSINANFVPAYFSLKSKFGSRFGIKASSAHITSGKSGSTGKDSNFRRKRLNEQDEMVFVMPASRGAFSRRVLRRRYEAKMPNRDSTE